MTPPRGDNWAGCVGVLVALVGWLVATRNHAALLMVCYGLLAGGIGFSVGDFMNMLGRAGWGPMGAEGPLRALDYWKWMEQLFGLIMGLGIGIGFAQLVRGNLAEPVEDEENGPLRLVALVFLFVVMMWINLFKNVRTWTRNQLLREGLFGLDPWWWFLLVGIVLTMAVLFAIVRHRQGKLVLVPASSFGRAQLLFLLILWVAVIAALLQVLPGIGRRGALFVHTTFWLTAGVCTLLVLNLSGEPRRGTGQGVPSEDASWLPGRGHLLAWAGVPILILAMAYLSVSTHAAPLPGSQLRFESVPEEKVEP